MSAIIGNYAPAPSIALPVRTGPYLVQPLADRDGGIANAHYTYARLSDGGSAIYALSSIEEWLPPMSPREKAEMFTDAARMPPMNQDGSVDIAALAERRRKEWAEAK